MRRQRIVILGSTGSIGRNTLAVISHLAADFEVVGLGAGTRWELLAKQARAWKPRWVALTDASAAGQLEAALPEDCTALVGEHALTELVEAARGDCVVAAVVGAAGLPATLRAVELGTKVALANKEALVIAGSLLMPLAHKTGATLIPVDSEHSAVFQALLAGHRVDVARIVLTASGGPFRNATAPDLERVTVEDALRHPTWKMGPKITIDSATMMNKALEIIEARWLFDLPPEKIDVVIHPESIVHSLVEFCDGSVVAQMGAPDMRVPIQYALTYPRRRPCPARRIRLHALGKLTFEPPDPARFPALRLGHEVAKRGGVSGAVLNAANEEANALFRRGDIGYTDIAAVCEETLQRSQTVADPDLEALQAADAWARAEVESLTAYSVRRR